MGYVLDLTGRTKKEIYDLGENFSKKSNGGNEISFTNAYMKKNSEPFSASAGNFTLAGWRMTAGKMN